MTSNVCLQKRYRLQCHWTNPFFMEAQHIELKVINSPTILGRVIQTVKKRNLVINRFVAEEADQREQTGIIKIYVKADVEKTGRLLRQLEKIIDVIEVNAT